MKFLTCVRRARGVSAQTAAFFVPSPTEIPKAICVIAVFNTGGNNLRQTPVFNIFVGYVKVIL